MKKFGLLALVMIALASCSKDDDTATTSTNGGGNNTNQNIAWEDTLVGRWYVHEAWYDGAPDVSSLNLRLNRKADGSYILENTQYIGTWEFIENKTKVHIDKGNSSYETVWDIKTISSKVIKIEFKSPFAGGTSAWELRPIL